MGWRDTIRDTPKKSWRDTIRDTPKAPEAAPEAEVPTHTDSLGRGLRQAATAGFSDEGGGIIDAILSKTGNLLTPEGTENPYADQPIKEVYAAGRNDERRRDAGAEKANPRSYLAGQLAGGIASSMVLPGSAVAQGAVGGLGLSESDSALGMAKDVAIGASVGEAGALLGQGIGKLAKLPMIESTSSKVSQYLRDIAENQSAAALGAERSTVRKLGQDAVKKAGGEALDSGVLSMLGNSKEMLVKNAAREASQGKEVADTLLKNKVAKEAGNKMLGFSDYALLGNAAHSPIAVGATLIAKKGAEKYGNQMAALSANSISKVVKEAPQTLGKYAPMLQQAAASGGKNLAITHFLTSQRDPEYQAIVKDIK